MNRFGIISIAFGIPLATTLWWHGASPIMSVIAAGLGSFALEVMIKQHKMLKNS